MTSNSICTQDHILQWPLSRHVVMQCVHRLYHLSAKVSLLHTVNYQYHIMNMRFGCRASELVKQFMEEAHSVALHPGGYTLLVGFPDKLRVFTILMDNLK